ncbi:MAG: hypothetical protein KDE53_30460, partial [Caldilineaceae bacterium]|nr:hypothetical protein [Caldilineaceae bacterium]
MKPRLLILTVAVTFCYGIWSIAQVYLPALHTVDIMAMRSIADAFDNHAAVSQVATNGATGVTGAAVSAPQHWQATATVSTLPIYTDALDGLWQSWSWSTTTSDWTTEPIHSGSASLAVTYDAGWGAFYLHAIDPIARQDYDLIRFWVHGGTTGGQVLRVVLADESNSFLGENVEVTVPANQWQLVEVNLSDLGNLSYISGIALQEGTGAAPATFYIDDYELVDLDLPPTPTPEPIAGPALIVDAGAERHPINPDIYGINYADETLAQAVNL